MSVLVESSQAASEWTLQDIKAFEIALANHYNDADKWEKIAKLLPNKSASEARRYYQQLEDDLKRIDVGKIPLPQYASTSSGGSEETAPSAKRAKLETAANGDRRKGVPWTEEEHKLFLLGLAKFGKGDWRNIARNYVVSRTPTQVASHAQKYFIRLNSMSKKDKRRASIHDITSPAGLAEMSASTAPTSHAYPIMHQPGMLPGIPGGMSMPSLPITAPPAHPMPVPMPLAPPVFMTAV